MGALTPERKLCMKSSLKNLWDCESQNRVLKFTMNGLPLAEPHPVKLDFGFYGNRSKNVLFYHSAINSNLTQISNNFIFFARFVYNIKFVNTLFELFNQSFTNGLFIGLILFS